MDIQTWLLFSSAALVVILIPGPLTLLMVSNSLNYGLKNSAPAFLGGVAASLCLLSASALGLGALLLASEQLFNCLKLIGALYLFYLAWQSWQASRAPNQPTSSTGAPPPPRPSTLFGKAFALGASNPKDILFFAAFLPQFITANSPIYTQLAVMIGTWASLDLACKLFYGLGAQWMSRYLRSGNGQRWFNRISAALFGSAGALSLMSSHNN
ncbi:LysE family translocator [Ectopseudomonas mendocina]|uniref:LysE family translocator n=1 Tax=Ectopseudomonas mendocina TaxID=300 RepID=A0ABZ2RKW9_ECTME